MTRPARPAATTLLAGAVLLLLPALAALQYRWLGQVSELERVRLQRALDNATTGVARDLDAELARVVDRLDLELPDGDVSARPPVLPPGPRAGLVAQVLYVRSVPGDTTGARALPALTCVGIPRVCAVADWPPGFEALRGDLAELFRRGSRRDGESLSRIVHAGGTSHPVIVVPQREPSRTRRNGGENRTLAGAALVVLDFDAVTGRLLPTLVDRHFGGIDRASFDVVVVNRERTAEVIYQQTATPPDQLLSQPDALTELLTLRVGELDEEDEPSERTIALSTPLAAAVERRGEDDDEEWVLAARHREGSLQAAVASLRVRNMALSSGILVLTGIAVGLIVVTTRRAQRLAEQQIEFVAGVSHELRTPVAAIHLAAANLADGTVEDSPRIRQYGTIIQTESQRLRDTVERILQFASLPSGQAGRPSMPVDLSALVRDVVRAALAASPAATVDVDLDAGLPVLNGDPAGVRTCVENLVGNAVKYGGRPPRVQVKVRADGQGGVRLSVRDNGPGLERADLPYLQEPFYRGRRALAERLPGNGLGLYLVARIAKAHGGRLTAGNPSGGGAEFILHLPAPAGTVARHEGNRPPGARAAQGEAP
ncbi:MAG: sensor histidine kinase [Vicinamibacterales bacterium]